MISWASFSIGFYFPVKVLRAKNYKSHFLWYFGQALGAPKFQNDALRQLYGNPTTSPSGGWESSSLSEGYPIAALLQHRSMLLMSNSAGTSQWTQASNIRLT
jgi:hypothetical protein